MLKNEDHKLPKFVEDVDCNSKSSEDRSPNCGENGDHTVYRDLRFKKKMYKLGAWVEVVPVICMSNLTERSR